MDYTYPTTRYDTLSEQQLYSMFAQDQFFALSADEKLDLTQAIVNNQCIKNGMPPCWVAFEAMEGGVAGYNTGTDIVLNQNMVCDQQFVANLELPDESIREHAVLLEDSNYRTLETALHEYRHAFQEQAVEGNVEASEEQVRAWSANMFTTSELSDGQFGCQYLKGENDYSLYVANPTELDAFKTSQEQMKDILQNMPDDHSKLAYIENLQANGWEAQVAELNGKYGQITNDAVKDVETVLCNAHYGEQQPVSEKMTAVVESEMAATHAALCQQDSTMTNNSEVDLFDAVQQDVSTSSEIMDYSENSNAVDATGVAIDTDGGMDSGSDGGMEGGIE